MAGALRRRVEINCEFLRPLAWAKESLTDALIELTRQFIEKTANRQTPAAEDAPRTKSGGGDGNRNPRSHPLPISGKAFALLIEGDRRKSH
ncbi:MAG TPA: hypothetical protein VG591_01530 [Burkholderiales bacterium]|jgi:hypothetical protein|nr:hypothetical protein [Burkholderiales bacterium]